MNADLYQAMVSLQEQEANLKQTRQGLRRQAITEVQAIINTFGLEASDFKFNVADESVKPRNVVAPKYRDDAGHTWTGRGRQPVWLQERLAQGAVLEDFIIAKGE